MKVKIKNRIYSSEEEPIMLILTDADKENIANMDEDAEKYCEFPDNISNVDIRKFMCIKKKEKYEIVDEIVSRVRSNTQRLILEMHEYNEAVEYKQPRMQDQLNTVNWLIDKGIHVDVVDAPVGLAEAKNEEFTVTMRTRRYSTIDEIEFGENTKSVFLYTWSLVQDFQNDKTFGLIRSDVSDKKCKLKDLSKKV